jgi:hypothetical protein
MSRCGSEDHNRICPLVDLTLTGNVTAKTDSNFATGDTISSSCRSRKSFDRFTEVAIDMMHHEESRVNPVI